MPGPRPLYLMLKPPPDIAIEIDRRRALLGIAAHYGRDRFHTTLLPIGDMADLPRGVVGRIERAILPIDAGPVAVSFNRLRRNALRGSGMRDLRALQRRLAARLTSAGLVARDYRFDPHLSLAYGPAPDRSATIDPLGWRAHDLLLIESVHGEGRHVPHACWTLSAPQLAFDFTA